MTELASTNPTPEPRLGGHGARLGARLLDRLLLWAPPIVVLVVGMPAPGSGDDRVGVLVVLCTLYVLAFACVQWYLLGARGESLGKLAFGLRIVDERGAPPGWARAILAREAVRLGIGAVPYLGTLLGVVDNCNVFRTDRRTWHDQAAGTYVVRSRPGASDAPLLAEVASAPARGGTTWSWVAAAVVGSFAIVASVGILAAIAIPNFIAMQLKAKRSEVPSNLAEIVHAEQQWHAAHGAWLAVGSREQAAAEVSGKAQRDWRGGPDWERLGWAPDHKVRGAYWVEVEGDELRVMGMSDVDGDGEYALYAAGTDGKATLLSDLHAY